MRELTFQLENKLDFANLESGEDDKTMEITLRAPSFNGQKHYFRVYQHLSAAIMHMAQKQAASTSKREQASSGEEMDGETVLMILSGGNSDLAEVIEDFCLLALDVARINEDTPLVQKHIEAIGPDDVLAMCGEYMAFFIAPSLLSTTKKRGSKRS